VEIKLCLLFGETEALKVGDKLVSVGHKLSPLDVSARSLSFTLDKVAGFVDDELYRTLTAFRGVTTWCQSVSR